MFLGLIRTSPTSLILHTYRRTLDERTGDCDFENEERHRRLFAAERDCLPASKLDEHLEEGRTKLPATALRRHWLLDMSQTVS